MDKYQNISLALSGMLQATVLVYELANHGSCNEKSFQQSLATIYKIDSDSISDIFNGAEGVKLGLVSLNKMISKSKGRVPSDSIRYLISLFTLERRLMKDKNALEHLSAGINQIMQQREFYGEDAAPIIANLASLYTDTIGQFKQRIMITGREEYMHQDDIMQRIRALLLAGLRAAVAWRQAGGNRLQLFFARSKLAATTDLLLK